MSVKPRAFALSDHGGVLATRDLGRVVGRELQDALVDAPGLVLSFAGVEVASPPFLDELLASIHASLHGGEANKLFVLDGLNDDVKESLVDRPRTPQACAREPRGRSDQATGRQSAAEGDVARGAAYGRIQCP